MDPGCDPDTTARMVGQLGLVTRAQLVVLGWTAEQVDGALRRGRLEAVHRGVYRVPAGGRPDGQAALAAILRIGPGARISAEGVLAHHRLGNVEAEAVGPVLVAPPRRPRSMCVAWRRDAAPDHDHAMLGPISATTVDRALVEVAADWPSRAWLGTFDHARWRKLASTAGVVEAAARIGRRHAGVRHVHRLLDAGELVQESLGERDLAEALAAIGLGDDEFRWQQQIAIHRVDVLLVAHRVVIEYDGGDFHTDPRDRARDEVRDAELTALGYQVLRIRARDLRDHRRLRAKLDAAIAAADERG